MTRSQAYRILGLGPEATEQELRRRYRSLALKVHPDTNPDPEANEQFIRLSQAVELLLTPERQRDNGIRARQSSKGESPEEQLARMEQAKKRFEQQRQKKQQENTLYFNQLTTGRRWLVFRWIMWTGIVLAIALTLDSVLPTHLEKDRLAGYTLNNYNGILYQKITSVRFEKNGDYFAKLNRGVWETSYPEVYIRKTWLLRTPVLFYSSDDYTLYETPFDFHLGAVRWLLFLLFSVPLFTYFRRRKDLTFVFMYQFSFWGIGLLEVYLLLTVNRLPHLLTLGFL